VRSKFGHPAPFNLTYMALGNEDCGKFNIYNANYDAFARAIRAKYPTIKLIANCDISRSVQNVDLFDYHVYNTPDWFTHNTNAFDNQNRQGPKVFVSEYAVTQQCGNGNLRAAIAEAAWMTGLVRNSDIVEIASYAPLFVNVNDRKWSPDAIQYNSSAIAATPSYYVQKLFMIHTGNVLLNSNLNFGGSAATVAVVSTMFMSRSTVVLTVVNYSAAVQPLTIQLQNAKSVVNPAVVYTLTGPSLDGENTLNNPIAISPATTSFANSATEFNYSFPANSLVILEIGVTK